MSLASGDNLPPASVLGFGAVTALGRDMRTLVDRLGRAPEESGGSPRRVVDDALADARTGRALRRAGRFPRMAVLAARDAWQAAGTAGQDVSMDRVGIIVASGLGPHARTFKFLDGILDCGDASALPTDFSHSVHNAAAAYITETLGWRGRCCTVTDFYVGFEQAVCLAQVWLAEGACDRVIVGAVEELGEVLLCVVPRMLAGASVDSPVNPGEGACFFTLGPASLAGLVNISTYIPRNRVDLLVRDEPLLPPHAAAREAPPVPARHTVTFSPYFGSMGTSSAFQTLGGLLCLQTGALLGRQLHAPAEDRLSDGTTPKVCLDSALVFQGSSSSESPAVHLTRNSI